MVSVDTLVSVTGREFPGQQIVDTPSALAADDAVFSGDVGLPTV